MEEIATTTTSTSASSPQRRLGLLQCPNAQSLGWGDGQVVATVASVNNGEDTNVNSNLASKEEISDVSSFPNSSLKEEDIVVQTTNEQKEIESIDTVSSSRKRPRAASTQQTSDEETQEAMKDGVEENDTYTSTTENKPLHLSVTLDYEKQPINNNSDPSSMKRSQILTITYHGGLSASSDSSRIPMKDYTSTVVGTISGKARIELLQLNSDTSAATKESSMTNISVDIFGYRISQSIDNNSSIIINRPDEWMNSLPVSVICQHSKESDQQPAYPAILRIRIQSIDGDKNNDIESTATNNESYYSAYPEETYQLNILPPNSLYPGNYLAAGSGVCTILEPWKGTLDNITAEGTDSIMNNKPMLDMSSNTIRLPNNTNRILICGAKGVGKSTLLRYATNRILSLQQSSNTEKSIDSKQCPTSSVAILDLDCGQAELSPPGMLTLTIISKPLLSDPPVHMVCDGSCDHYGSQSNNDEDCIKHEAAYFFGDITSKADPDTYIQMASQLMRRYNQHQEQAKQEYGSDNNIPLLVNTDGWVKGLGYEILSAIIGVVNPGHIIQINGSTKAKTFDMSPSNSGSLIHVIQSFDESSLPALDDDNRSCRSTDSRNSSTGPLLASSSDHRIHRLCSYFLGGYDKMINLRSRIPGNEHEMISFHRERGLCDPSNIIGLTLASMRPYAVPFQSINLYPPSGLLDNMTEIRPLAGMRGDLASNDVIECLNGSIVGLCTKQDTFDAPFNCNAGSGVPTLNCIGLGIVRSVDHSRKLFFVLTPVHPQLLANVTSLVGGNISLPLECAYRGVHADSFPFMSCSHTLTNSTLGMGAMKSRNN